MLTQTRSLTLRSLPLTRAHHVRSIRLIPHNNMRHIPLPNPRLERLCRTRRIRVYDPCSGVIGEVDDEASGSEDEKGVFLLLSSLYSSPSTFDFLCSSIYFDLLCSALPLPFRFFDL